MSNKLYDFLSACVKLGLPAAATLYFGLSQIWGFPYGEQVVGTIALLETFLGVTLLIAARKYEKTADGQIIINRHDPSVDVVRVNFENEPTDYTNGATVQFKVVTDMTEPLVVPPVDAEDSR